MPISRAPWLLASTGMPAMCRSIVLVEVWVPVVGESPAPAVVPVNWRKKSRIMGRSLGHAGFVVEDGIAGTDWDTAEGGDALAIELLKAKQDVGLVHRLEIEVGADDTVAVHNRTTHVGSNFRRVRGLDGGGRGRSGWQAIEATDYQVDQVRCVDAGELGDVDVADANGVAPVTEDEADFPFEVVAIGLVGVARGVLDRPLAHVTVLETGYLSLREGGVSGVSTPDGDPQGGISRASTSCVEDVGRSCSISRCDR